MNNNTNKNIMNTLTPEEEAECQRLDNLDKKWDTQFEDIRHSEMVLALKKKNILETLTEDQAGLWHMASAICGEAGELFDAVKKSVIYCKDLDRENVVEELGDLEFYLEGVRQYLNITRKETLEANYKKLTKRYEGMRYSDKAAINRADKQ